MSGPLSATDTDIDPGLTEVSPGAIEISESREATVGAMRVRRSLPRRQRRTVGAWCFADHMGPQAVTETHGLDVGPHPHMGLHTVTWLLAGAVLHRDSLGSEQLIRPGEINLMTAGRGVAHAEEASRTYRGVLHGVQLWIAQPDAARNGSSGFRHHPEVPRAELPGAEAWVLTGAFGDAVGPTLAETPLVGADVSVRPGASAWRLNPRFEHALVVLEGALDVEGNPLEAGLMAYLGVGRAEVGVVAREPSRVLLLGGEPFAEPIVMWWNFVARNREELALARDEWERSGERFGDTGSSLPRIAAPPLVISQRPHS
jgi:quercetin 2,3-dioxygenase